MEVNIGDTKSKIPTLFKTRIVIKTPIGKQESTSKNVSETKAQKREEKIEKITLPPRTTNETIRNRSKLYKYTQALLARKTHIVLIY